MAKYNLHKDIRDLAEGENITITKDSEGDLVISATGGATEALAAMLEWENLKASRTFDTEVWTGKMAGEDKVYGKVIDLGALPNTTAKNVDCNIQSLKKFNEIYGYAYNPETTYLYRLPYAHPNPIYNIVFQSQDQSVHIYLETGADRSTYPGVAFIEYTCTDR